MLVGRVLQLLALVELCGKNCAVDQTVVSNQECGQAIVQNKNEIDWYPTGKTVFVGL